MGEYINYLGSPLKLGTCEDLYYTRFEDLCRVVTRCDRIDGNLAPTEYLNAAHGWRYRFPFPEEDNIEFGAYEEYDKGLVISVPKDSLIQPDSHDTITASLSCKRTYNVNVFVPCPASGELQLRSSPIPDDRPIEIVQQKQVDEELWTVVRCGWCGVTFRLPHSEAEWLIGHIMRKYVNEFRETYSNREYYREIAKRIAAGYKGLRNLQLAEIQERQNV